MKRILLLIIIIIIFSSCKATQIIRAEPISLAEGVREVIVALNSFSELQTSEINGLVPAEVIIEFNISAGKKNNRNASVEIVPAAVVTKLGVGWSSEVTESTSNKITIKFRSILFATENEMLNQKTPEDLTELYEKLKKLGWNIKTN